VFWRKPDLEMGKSLDWTACPSWGWFKHPASSNTCWNTPKTLAAEGQSHWAFECSRRFQDNSPSIVVHFGLERQRRANRVSDALASIAEVGLFLRGDVLVGLSRGDSIGSLDCGTICESAQEISGCADSMADGAVSCKPLSKRQFPVTSGKTAN
jgi:hypothetical protein